MMTGIEVQNMLMEAIRAMSVGVLGVFAVQGIFYLALKLMMLRVKDGAAKDE